MYVCMYVCMYSGVERGGGGASAPGPGPVVGARAKLDFFLGGGGDRAQWRIRGGG